MITTSMIDDYVKSHFDLSIGTAAAIAALVQATDIVYTDSQGVALDIKRYNGNVDTLIVNVETITRNIIQAIDTTIRDKVINSYQEYLYELVVREIEYIDNLLEDKLEKGVYFLFPDYTKVYDIYYMPKKRMVPTKKDIMNEAISNITFSISKKAERLNINYISHDFQIHMKGDVLILTHHAHDLLNVKYNSKLKLLESHTGSVIDSSNFNKKYKNSTKLDTTRLPWNETLVFILGTAAIASPGRGNLKIVLDIAQKNKWIPSTSLAKVKANLQRNNDIKDFVKFKGVY